MRDDDRRARLQQTLSEAVQYADAAIEATQASEFDLVSLRVARRVLVDRYVEGLLATDRLGGATSSDVVEIWNSMIAMMNACLQIGATGFRVTSSRPFVQEQQVKLMNEANAPARDKAWSLKKEILLAHIVDVAAAKAHPYQTAKSIEHLVNAELLRRGVSKSGKDTRTIQRWIEKLPDPSSSDIS